MASHRGPGPQQAIPRGLQSRHGPIPSGRRSHLPTRHLAHGPVPRHARRLRLTSIPAPRHNLASRTPTERRPPNKPYPRLDPRGPRHDRVRHQATRTQSALRPARADPRRRAAQKRDPWSEICWDFLKNGSLVWDFLLVLSMPRLVDKIASRPISTRHNSFRHTHNGWFPPRRLAVQCHISECSVITRR